ncbi:TPA: hypothetical protein VMX41_001817 [Streptococcus pyogenes]|nr:hypothetical protein [Streptococcus pyogenes]
MLAIIRAIEAGTPLPRGSYRTSKGRDILLESMGIMHLHLGRADSAELLYLIQYPEHVVLLEVGSHEHFGVPIGGKLDRDYGKAIITARERRRRMTWLKVQQRKD